MSHCVAWLVCDNFFKTNETNWNINICSSVSPWLRVMHSLSTYLLTYLNSKRKILIKKNSLDKFAYRVPINNVWYKYLHQMTQFVLQRHHIRRFLQRIKIIKTGNNDKFYRILIFLYFQYTFFLLFKQITTFILAAEITKGMASITANQQPSHFDFSFNCIANFHWQQLLIETKNLSKPKMAMEWRAELEAAANRQKSLPKCITEAVSIHL